MTDRIDPGRPVAAVQDAAVEHALTVGDSRRALALVGVLEPLREASGDDPVLTALSTTLTAWVGLRERDPEFGEPPSETDSVSSFDADTGGGPDIAPAAPFEAGTDTDDSGRAPPPAAVGAAVARERFGVDIGRAATLAGCQQAVVERMIEARRGNDLSSSE